MQLQSLSRRYTVRQLMKTDVDVPHGENTISRMRHMPVSILPSNKSVHPHWLRRTAPGRCFGHCADHHRPDQRNVR